MNKVDSTKEEEAEEAATGFYPYQDKHKYGLTSDSHKKEEQEKDKKPVPFQCAVCGLNEICHFYGKKPPFARGQIEFKEDTFVMMDPFSPREKGRPHFLTIGGQCGFCSNSVCVACSLFYRFRVCKDCGLLNIDSFPVEVQAKVKKL